MEGSGRSVIWGTILWLVWNYWGKQTKNSVSAWQSSFESNTFRTHVINVSAWASLLGLVNWSIQRLLQPELMHTSKVMKNQKLHICGSLNVSTLKLQPSVRVPANMFFENKRSLQLLSSLPPNMFVWTHYLHTYYESNYNHSLNMVVKPQYFARLQCYFPFSLQLIWVMAILFHTSVATAGIHWFPPALSRAAFSALRTATPSGNMKLFPGAAEKSPITKILN
jgi:hypothetical protein